MKLRIKENCALRGITQKELASQLGVSEVTLSRATNGNTSLETLEKIANALGVPVAELFEAPKEGVITCPHCGKQINLEAKP